MATIADLTKSLTYAEAKAKIYAAVEANGVDVASWSDGAPIRAVVAGCSAMLSGFSVLTTSLFNSGFLSSAGTGYLEVLAEDVYNTTAQVAQSGTGDLTLDNSAGGGSYALDPGDLTLRDPATGKEYTNTALITLLPAGTVTGVPAIAVEAGSASSAGVGDVTEIVSPTMPGVTVTNTTAFIGLDAESPEPLRKRARANLGASSPNGPSDAFDAVAKRAKRVDGTTLIGVTRTRGFPDNATGLINFFVGGATAGITGNVGDTATDLGKVDDDIQREATALCVTVTTASAVAFPVDVVIEVWMWDDLDLTDAALRAQATANLTRLIQEETPIGGIEVDGDIGKIFRDALIGEVKEASVGKIFKSNMTTPVADLYPATNDLPVFGSLTMTINRVKRQ